MMKEDSFVICSDCFKRHGIQLMAKRFGINNGIQCPHCGSFNGFKLSIQNVKDLAVEYIVNGSYLRTDFGGAPIYMLSDCSSGESLFEYDPDLTLIESVIGLSTFLYGPATWRVGCTRWLDDLHSDDTLIKDKAIRRLVLSCDKKMLSPGDIYYRLLSHLYGGVMDPLTFDSPHWSYQQDGRFGLTSTSVLYLSSNIESAIHECRVTIEDELTLAAIAINKPLKILDLTVCNKSSYDPSEDISYSMRLLCSAGKGAYPITQMIAQEVYHQGYDGIMYWSFFDSVSHNGGKNLALFGTPIKAERVRVVSIDRVLLNSIKYTYSLGVLLP